VTPPRAVDLPISWVELRAFCARHGLRYEAVAREIVRERIFGRIGANVDAQRVQSERIRILTGGAPAECIKAHDRFTALLAEHDGLYAALDTLGKTP
jgi:hypothetical protein